MPLANKIMHTKDMYYLREIERMSQWSQQDIASWQNDRFLKLIKHFHLNTRYIPKLFAEHGITISSFKSIEDISTFPVLNKEHYIKFQNEITPRNLHSINYKASSTGGSSGDPLNFLLDMNSWSYVVANKIFNWSKIGFNYGDSHIALGSSSLFPKSKSLKHSIFHWLKNEIPLNGMNMSESVCEDYLSTIKRKRIKYVYGYASSIYLLAAYINKCNEEAPSVKGVFPTSEMLTDNFRKEIENAFHCPIMDSYGARDGGITAFEVTPGNYHVGYNSYINPTPTQGNSPAPLLITDLLNFAFPFINYQIGDLIELGNDTEKTFNGQVIKKIYGRESDIIYLKNGNIVTGPGFTILFKDFNILAYQVRKINNQHLECKIIPSSNYSNQEESLILNAIRKYTGKDCVVDLLYIKEMPIGSNGKVKYFIS